MQQIDSACDYTTGQGCTISCREIGNLPFFNELQNNYGCRPIYDTTGQMVVGLDCPMPCTTAKRLCNGVSTGSPVMITDVLALALYSNETQDFIGYLKGNNGDDGEDVCSDQREEIFQVSPDLSDSNGFSHSSDSSHRESQYARRVRERNSRWLVNETLPKSIKIEPFPTTSIPSCGCSHDFHVKYNQPYRLYTSNYFSGCPFKLLSRRQKVNTNEPTNKNVVCLYQQGKPTSEQYHQNQFECKVQDSGWMFIPLSQDHQGMNLSRNERFRISIWPYSFSDSRTTSHDGLPHYLKWVEEEGNFNLVSLDKATIFSFPSSPVDKLYGPDCLFIPSNGSLYENYPSNNVNKNNFILADHSNMNNSAASNLTSTTGAETGTTTTNGTTAAGLGQQFQQIRQQAAARRRSIGTNTNGGTTSTTGQTSMSATPSTPPMNTNYPSDGKGVNIYIDTTGGSNYGTPGSNIPPYLAGSTATAGMTPGGTNNGIGPGLAGAAGATGAGALTAVVLPNPSNYVAEANQSFKNCSWAWIVGLILLGILVAVLYTWYKRDKR